MVAIVLSKLLDSWERIETSVNIPNKEKNWKVPMLENKNSYDVGNSILFHQSFYV